MGGAHRRYHADTMLNLPQVYVPMISYRTFNPPPHTLPVPDGAGLFYTTTQPTTLNVLRQYALHLRFVPPPASDGLPESATAPERNPLPFIHKPNTLDRDGIAVSAGWVVGERSACYRTDLTRKRGSVTSHSTPEPRERTERAKQAQESCTRHSCQTKDPKCAPPDPVVCAYK